jgi:sugar porter (SP) family MFS transporter
MADRVTGVTGATSTKATYFFGALGGLLFGYDLGIVAGALLFITPEMGLTKLDQGLVTSALIFGALLTAPTCGPVADRVGRRPVVLASGLVFALGAILAGLAPNVLVVILSRFIMGIAVGTASVMVPIYLSELAPAAVRGKLSGLNQLMISSGILLAYLVNLALTPFDAWRWMFALAAVPAVVLLIGVYFQPESPRWLVQKGRIEEAREVLARSRDEAEVTRELAEIQEIARQGSTGIGAMELIRTKRFRKVLLIGCGLAFLQQVIGINTIIYYAPTILKSIGFGTSAAILANAGLGVLTVVVTVIMLMMVDRVGRKRPLMLGALGMCVCMLLLGFVFFSSGLKGGGSGWLTITALALFKISFSLSWGGIVWIMLGEIFPLRVRGAAMGVATFFNWLGNLLVGLFFPILLGIGAGTVFLIFAAVAIVAFVFATSLVPETKGRSLEQIESELVLSR